MDTQTAVENFPETQQKQEEPISNSTHQVSSLDDDNETTPCNDKQIALYDPTANQPEPDPDPIQWKKPSAESNSGPQRVLPSIGAYTVQCAVCYKWRLIPTKEKYEEIREHIMVEPFTCDVAKEWRTEVCCETAGDIEQDNSRLWAIDKPSIAQTPPGWKRELRIRAEGSSRFADVYYISPLGKTLRSMVEVQKYLEKHPEFIAQGVTLSQFSFKIPKPLQENYVRKRIPSNAPGDSNLGVPRPLLTIEANPLSWAAPADTSTLQLARTDDISPPVKKKARPSTKRTHKSNPLQHNSLNFEIKGPSLPPNDVNEL